MASLPSSPSATLHYKACTKHFPVLLCTTKLAQSTSQYYFVLQSLRKELPSTTLYYKAQSISQYYFVLQSLHKALPSTTLYYKACTSYFPVLLCTAKLAQSTSQYHFVLQSLHKVFPSTTLYYKACTKHVPLLLCFGNPCLCWWHHGASAGVVEKSVFWFKHGCMLGLLIRDKLNLEHFCGAPFVLSSCGHCYKEGECPKIDR